MAAEIPPAAFGTLAIYALDDETVVDVVGSGPGQIVEFDGRDVPDDLTVEYVPNEIGWQDTVTATVRHDLALLPGPGRLLARRVRHPDGSTDRVADAIVRQGSVYVYPLEATATLGNEGQKSVIPYVHYLY